MRFQLPTAEDDLWEQVVLALLRQRDVSEPQARDHLRLLEELAFHKQFCHRTLTQNFVLNTATWLAGEMKLSGLGDKARDWLKELEHWQLLVLHGSGNDATYEFPIPGLDEYFAARHLAARWAEGDERYRAWLPCFDGWWERGKGQTCPNSHCHAALPTFRDLFRRAEYEETFLLMVGLLKEAEREEMLLKGIQPDVGTGLKWLIRCRFTHLTIARSLAAEGLSLVQEHMRRRWGMISEYDLRPNISSWLAMLEDIRVPDNLESILAYFLRVLRRRASNALPGVGGEDWEVSRSAVHALALMGEPAVPALMQALKDKKLQVRFLAADALGNSWMSTPAVISSLIEVLSTDKWEEVRTEAAHALAWIGRPALKPLLLLGKDSDVKIRRAAAFALSSMPVFRGGRQAVKGLIELFGDEDGEVRWRAIHGVGESGDAWAISALQGLLNGSNERVRAAAATALKFIDDRIRFWMGLLKDEFFDTRRMAAEALGEIGDCREIPCLNELLDDPDEWVRAAARKALKQVQRRTGSKVGSRL